MDRTLLLSDPAKPKHKRPIHSHTLFAENEEVDRDDIALNEEAYVQKALELEQAKIRKDLEDRKYRRKLSYTTYTTEPRPAPEVWCSI